MKKERIEGIDPSVNVKEAPTIAPSPGNSVNTSPPQQPEGGRGIGGHVVRIRAYNRWEEDPQLCLCIGTGRTAFSEQWGRSLTTRL